MVVARFGQKNTKQGKSMVGKKKKSESVVVCCYFQNGDRIVKARQGRKKKRKKNEGVSEGCLLYAACGKVLRSNCQSPFFCCSMVAVFFVT